MLFARSLVEHWRQLWVAEEPPKVVDREAEAGDSEPEDDTAESQEGVDLWDWDFVEESPVAEEPLAEDHAADSPRAPCTVHDALPAVPTAPVAVRVIGASELRVRGVPVDPGLASPIAPEDEASGVLEVIGAVDEDPGLASPIAPEDEVIGPLEVLEDPGLASPSAPEDEVSHEPKERASVEPALRTKRLIIPCGMPPGRVPTGSEDELAAKLQKRLAKVEKEGLVLLKSQLPSLADARASSAEEAKAARLPKWGQSTAQLLYASKRHSWFDFEELEEEERQRPSGAASPGAAEPRP